MTVGKLRYAVSSIYHKFEKLNYNRQYDKQETALPRGMPFAGFLPDRRVFTFSGRPHVARYPKTDAKLGIIYDMEVDKMVKKVDKIKRARITASPSDVEVSK